MIKLLSLSPSHSTTRLCFKLLDERYLGDDGRVKEEFKFNISFPELKIKNSTLIGKPEDKFETMLFLPEGENRKGEGGLRTKGYFKFSYKKIDDEWYIIDDEDKSLQKVLLPTEVALNQSIEYLPLVTIITVVYNGEKYLEDTIKSVINQTYPNIEYIIIDGGSTDGTLDIIKKYDDYIDYWVSEKDEGIYDAMNKGIDVARGMWLNFMNAGDIFWDKEILNLIQNNKYLYNESIDFIYSDTILDGKETCFCDINHNKVIHQSIIYKKKVHNDLGYYIVYPNFFLSDYVLFLLSKTKFKWVKFKYPISIYSTLGTESKFTIHLKQRIGVDLAFGNIDRLRASLFLLFYPFYRKLKKIVKNIVKKLGRHLT